MNQLQTGKFIAEIRKERKLTQAELGDRIGVTNKTVSRWENGNYMPDISVIPLLCKELGVSANELISGKKLNDDDFKTNADKNLMISFNQIKKIKHEKSIIDFFTGSGTGIVVSCLISPDTIRRTIAIVVGISMILIGWYRKSLYDRSIIDQMEDMCE